MRAHAILIQLFALCLIGCDSDRLSYEKKREAQVQRFQKQAELEEQELVNFAKENSATVIEFPNTATINLQKKYQNRIIATMAWLDDVYIDSQQEHIAVFISDRVFRKIYYKLSISNELVSEIDSLIDSESKYLMLAASISGIKPFYITEKSCDELDCIDIQVSLNRFDMLSKSYLIRGRLIGVRRPKS